MELLPRIANAIDAPELAGLVNRAYRPRTSEPGWTHEAELVSGDRTTADQVLSLFKPHSHLLVLCSGAHIVACVHIELDGPVVHLGMLATEPSMQMRGLGKQMLLCAEQYAMLNGQPEMFRMTVLSCRLELIEFYERRGYRRTGEAQGYPVLAGVGQPLIAGLQVEGLVKRCAL